MSASQNNQIDIHNNKPFYIVSLLTIKAKSNNKQRHS